VLAIPLEQASPVQNLIGPPVSMLVQQVRSPALDCQIGRAHV